MARAGFKDHPKFKRLVFLLKEPIPHVWGYLECLWDVSYQRRCDLIGDAIDVELNAMFPGEAGKLVAALSDPTVRFLDCVDGVYYVHDLADYAPPYVKASKKFRLLNPTDERSSTFKLKTSHTVVDECATTSHTVRDQNGAKSHPELPSAPQRRESIEERGVKREEEREALSPETQARSLKKQNAVELAKRFVDVQVRKERVADVAETIDAMLVAGYETADFAQEIDKPPNERDRSERFFKIRDRLEKAKRKPTKTTALDAESHKKMIREMVAKQSKG